MKMKLKNMILNIITDKNIRFIILIILCSIYFLFTAFYSFGRLNTQNLKYLTGTMYNIEFDSGRSSYVTFSVDNNTRFYVQTNVLNKGSAKEIANSLRSATIPNNEATIYYTQRRNLLPGFYNYSSYERVVAIQINEQFIISTDDYNQANSGTFIGVLAVAIIFFIFALILIKLVI